MISDTHAKMLDEIFGKYKLEIGKLGGVYSIIVLLPVSEDTQTVLNKYEAATLEHAIEKTYAAFITEGQWQTIG